MIQALRNQQLASKTLQTNPDHLEHPENHKNNFNEEYYSDDDDQYQYDNYDEEEPEEEEDYNIVLYNLPDKKVDHHKEKLLKETLKQRNQQLLEKKQPKPSFTFTETNSISIKKSLRLSKSKLQVKFTCYIPEKALLLVVLWDQKTLHIYNTMNFKLTAIKRSNMHLTCINYSKHLKMILVGGFEDIIQMWNPNTLEVHARSLEKEYFSVHTLAYIPKANIIVAVMSNKILLYNTGLRQIHAFNIRHYPNFWDCEASDIQAISHNLVLVACRYKYQKKVYLINLKKKLIKEWENSHVPSSSCVTLTENFPKTIFTCLSVEANQPLNISVWELPAKLTQFTIDAKTEEFSVVRKTLTDDYFCHLSCIENNKKYLLAHKNNSSVTLVLEIKAEKVEVLHLISEFSVLSANYLCKSFFIEAKSAIVQINEKNMISIFSLWPYKKKTENKEIKVKF